MAKIKQMRIVDQVMDYIKQQIADGVYAPGDKIPTEQELAQELGVGRSSIREAIKIFNYLGIMESMSARGTFIRDRTKISSESLTWALLLGHDEIAEVVETRGAIELWSFLQLTDLYKHDPQRAEPVVAQLKAQIEKMEHAHEKGDQATMVDSDYEFHRIVIEGCGNKIFQELYIVLRSFMYDEIEKSQRQESNRRHIIEEHKALLDALITGDKLRAEEAYLAHINNIKSLMNIEKDSAAPPASRV